MREASARFGSQYICITSIRRSTPSHIGSTHATLTRRPTDRPTTLLYKEKTTPYSPASLLRPYFFFSIYFSLPLCLDGGFCFCSYCVILLEISCFFVVECFVVVVTVIVPFSPTCEVVCASPRVLTLRETVNNNNFVDFHLSVVCGKRQPFLIITQM